MGFVVDIVTGSSQGIGRAIAESIAHFRALEIPDAKVAKPYALFLIGRNMERGQKSASDIQKRCGGSFPVYFEPCDLSDYDSVLDLRGRIGQRLLDDFHIGVLVNDAAECPVNQELVVRQRIDEQGAIVSEQIDKQFATNVLGYHFMMKALRPHFAAEISLNDDDDGTKTKPTHIVNVASNWAGDLDFNDLQFKRRAYDNDAAYRQSKQCNRMLTKIWSERLDGVAFVNACHPGDPCTTLSTALGYNMWSAAPSRKMVETESPIPFLCGFGPNSLSTTGGWFDGRGTSPLRCRFGSLTKDNKRLFDICESFAVSK